MKPETKTKNPKDDFLNEISYDSFNSTHMGTSLSPEQGSWQTLQPKQGKFVEARIAHHMRTLNAIFSDQSLNMEMRDLILTNKLIIDNPSELNDADLKSSLDQLWSLEPSKLFEIEATLMAFGRPSLPIQDDSYHSPKSEVLKTRLDLQKKSIHAGIRMTGQIQNTSFTTQPQTLGTAWFISPDIIVTTKNIATRIRKERKGGSSDDLINVNTSDYQIELKNEMDRSDSRAIPIIGIAYIANENEENFAFLKTDSSSFGEFSLFKYDETIHKGSNLCAIGYPTDEDSGNGADNVYHRLIDPLQQIKRLAPGRIVKTSKNILSHDCCTVGGSEGSLLLNLDTGNIAGMHTFGKYGFGQYGVAASIIMKKFRQLHL